MSNNRKNNSNIDSITKSIELTSIGSALNYQNNISDLIKKALPTNFFEKMNQSLFPLNSVKNMERMIVNPALTESINKLGKSIPNTSFSHESFKNISSPNIGKLLESNNLFDKGLLKSINNTSYLTKNVISSDIFKNFNKSLESLNSIKNIQPILTSSALAELINNLNINFPKIDLLHEKYSLNKILDSNNFFDKSLFKGINNLINSQGFQNSGLESFLNKDINENSILEEIESVDISIKDEIISGKGFNGLSERAREICINILVHILIPIIVSISASYIYDNYIKVYDETKNIKTSTEVKKITRNHNDAFDRKALKDYGVTKVESLNLRFSPSMKSKVITSLQLGTLVYVINSSNRSWLFVEVKIDNDLIQGWISRRYTSRFK